MYILYNLCVRAYACVWVGFSGTGAGYSGYHQYAPDYTTNRTAFYTDGLTEEEQLETAIRNSLNDRGEREMSSKYVTKSLWIRASQLVPKY